MNRYTVALLVVILITFPSWVLLFWPTSGPKWECFDGWLVGHTYMHAWPADLYAPPRHGAHTWLCGQNLRFHGPSPMPGALIPNHEGTKGGR